MLHRAFEYIANVQFVADLLQINGLSFERKRGVSADDQRAVNSRQVRREAFSHTINEVVLLGVTTEVSERQHNNGQARR